MLSLPRLLTSTIASITLGFSAIAVEPIPLAEVLVTNSVDLDRPGTVVRISLSDLGVPVESAEHKRLGIWEDGIPVPCHVSADGGELLLQIDLKPGEEKTLLVGLAASGDGVARVEIQRTHAEISQKTDGHWKGREYIGGHFRNVTRTTTPPEHTDHSWYYRYEGPGWENEKVGYRLYLDWRNGIDIFGKKVNGLVLPEVGQDGFDSYHEPADWGMDILKVGDAMGIGGFGHWDGEKAVRVSDAESITCTILRNDGLLSAFRNEYKNWDFGKGTTNLQADFQIVSGSYLTEVTLHADNEKVRIVTGLPDHGVEVFRGAISEGNVSIPKSSWSYIATYGEQSLDGAMLGMVVFFRGGNFQEFVEDDNNFMVRLRSSGGVVQYRFGALWAESAPEAASREAFLEYLDSTLEQLNKPIRVLVNSAVRNHLVSLHEPLEDPLYWGTALGRSIMERRGDSLSNKSFNDEAGRYAQWSYTTGLLSGSLYQLGQHAGDKDLEAFGEATISSFIASDGTIATYKQSDYNIDKINSGKMVLELLATTGEERYKLAAGHLLDQLAKHPRTSGGAFWHKKIYPWQVWLDGVYMGAPFLARSALLFDEPHYLDEVLTEFRIVRTELRDPVTGLYFHGWDESREQSWSDPETGLSDEFWGRGMGWYAMALVDCLDYYDEGSEGHAFLVETLQEFAADIVRYQDPATGTWWQVVNKPGQTGNYLESSASSMFVYTLAKGINRGYLPVTFVDDVRKGYSGLVNEFIDVDSAGLVSLRNVCQVAGLGLGRDGTFDYYASEPVVKNDSKGLGPFLLAAGEVDKLLKSGSGN